MMTLSTVGTDWDDPQAWLDETARIIKIDGTWHDAHEPTHASEWFAIYKARGYTDPGSAAEAILANLLVCFYPDFSDGVDLDAYTYAEAVS